MDKGKLTPVDLSKSAVRQMHMTDRIVMDFGQSVTPEHVKMWVDHLTGSVQRRKRVPIKADTLLLTDTNLYVVTGKNISMIGGGDVMDGVDTPIIIKGPKPKFPDPDEFERILIDLKGWVMNFKDIVRGGTQLNGEQLKSNLPGQAGVH